MDTERLFVAVPISEPVRKGLTTYLKSLLKGKPFPGRHPSPENWHFTLKFLGNVSEAVRNSFFTSLENTDLGKAFCITLDGLGAFPKPSKASVFWIGVGQGGEPFCELAAAVEQAAIGEGFSAENRPFRPHLTLSRIRPPQNLRHLIGTSDSFGMKMMIDEVLIYKSHLSSAGARYEVIKRFPLAR